MLLAPATGGCGYSVAPNSPGSTRQSVRIRLVSLTGRVLLGRYNRTQVSPQLEGRLRLTRAEQPAVLSRRLRMTFNIARDR